MNVLIYFKPLLLFTITLNKQIMISYAYMLKFILYYVNIKNEMDRVKDLFI